MGEEKSLIRLEAITKAYQMGSETLKALNSVTLEINKGEYAAILGPSGSGKSTLMHILGCLDTPTSGQYYLHGDNVSGLSRRRLAMIRNRHIGFIFQNFNLLEYATALENVALPLIYRGESLAKRNAKAAKLLASLGLGDRLHHKPNELSGGQRQRVAVCRALVTDAEVILADEPTGNLDTHSGDGVVEIFESLVEQGKTVIVVTHDNEMAQRTNRIIRIRDGVLA